MNTPTDFYPVLDNGDPAVSLEADWRRFIHETRWAIEETGRSMDELPQGLESRREGNDIVISSKGIDVGRFPYYRILDVDWHRIADYLASAARDESLDDENRQTAAMAHHVLRYEPERVEAPPAQDYVVIPVNDNGDYVMKVHRWDGVPSWPRSCTRYCERPDSDCYPGCFA